MEQEGTPCGHDDGDGVPLFPLEVLAGLDAGARQVMAEVIGLHREFPSWAVWVPHRGRPWIAVRPASARAPGPDLPMIWVRAGTVADLAARMRGAEQQLAPP